MHLQKKSLRSAREGAHTSPCKAILMFKAPPPNLLDLALIFVAFGGEKIGFQQINLDRPSKTKNLKIRPYNKTSHLRRNGMVYKCQLLEAFMKYQLTPCGNPSLDNVQCLSRLRPKHHDQLHIQPYSLYSSPGEEHQHEILEEGSAKPTQHTESGHVTSNQEDEVETSERLSHIQYYLGVSATSQFPAVSTIITSVSL